MRLVCAGARTGSLEHAFESVSVVVQISSEHIVSINTPSSGRQITLLELMVAMKRQPDQFHVSVE